VEQDTRFTVTDNLIILVRVKLNPVLVLVSLSSQELNTANRTFFFLVSPVPKRHSLIGVSSESNDVLVVSGEIHVSDTIGMGVQVSTDRSSSSGIPNDQHRVFTGISGDDPSLVVRASNSSDLIAVTLEKVTLLVFSVIVNNTSMSSGVENVGSAAFIVGEVVDTLVNVFVKSNNPVELESLKVLILLGFGLALPLVV